MLSYLLNLLSQGTVQVTVFLASRLVIRDRTLLAVDTLGITVGGGELQDEIVSIPWSCVHSVTTRQATVTA